MIKHITFICLLFSLTLFAQESKDIISVSFDKTSLVEALETVSEQSGYDFYYMEEWVANITISERYENKALDFILEDILSNTLLNYYIIKEEGRIILTKGSRIYGELPKGFFGVKDKELETTSMVSNSFRRMNPSFQKDANISKQQRKSETVRIGKDKGNYNENTLELSGRILNIETGEPLPNVLIVATNTNNAVVSDSNGLYSLILSPGSHRIEVSSLGLEKKKTNVIIYDSGSYDFKLYENIEQLDEVTLSANRTQNVEQADMGKTEIDAEASKNIPLILGERNLFKVATSLPGISTVGEAATGFNVRGGKTDQNLVLLDNATIYNPTHFFGIFQAINPFVTKSLTVYKGNIPANYGGRLSSVFDIKTTDGSTTEFKGEGSIGPVTNNLALEIPIVKEKSSLVLGARSSYSDWILKALDEPSLSNSTASFYDFVANYTHQLTDSDKVKVSGYHSNDAFSITSDSLYRYDNSLFSLQWTHRFNDTKKGALVLAHSAYNFDIDYDGSANDDFILGYGLKETEAKFKIDQVVADKHNIDYGLTVKRYSISPGDLEPRNSNSDIDNVSIASERAIEGGLFVGGDYEVNDRLLLNLGVRMSFFTSMGPASQRIYAENQPRTSGNLEEIVERDKGELYQTYAYPEARFAARYFLKPDLSIKASYNNSTQFIHTLTNNTTVTPVDTWKLSDNNIKPSRSSLYALGVFQNLNENLYELSLEGYYKSSTNILDFRTGAQLFLNETIETEVLQGNGRAYGVEVLLKKNEGKLNGWLAYTYSRSLLQLDSPFSQERVNNGAYFSSNFDRPHDVSAVLNYKFTQRFSLSTNFVYQTGRPVTYPVGRYTFNNADFVLYSDRNAFRIPDFYRLDLSFNVEGNHKIKKLAHSFWTFSIYNVLGRNNPYSVFFVTEQGQIKAFQSSIFAIPIPSITYNFKF